MVSSNDLLLITGASRKQGTAILTSLSKEKYPGHLRLQCQSISSAKKLVEQYPNAEVIQASFTDPTSAEKLLHGVSTAYLLTPGMHPNELISGMTFIDSAIHSYHSGVLQHLTFASVIHSQLTSLINHKNKLEMEENIIESGIPFTILQPTHFMDNIPISYLAHQAATQDKIVFDALFKPSTKISFLALSDLGEAVATIILDPKTYLYGLFELVSSAEPMSYNEVMVIGSQVLGKNIEIKVLEVEPAVNMLGSFAIPEKMDESGKQVMRDGLEAMIRHYECYV